LKKLFCFLLVLLILPLASCWSTGKEKPAESSDVSTEISSAGVSEVFSEESTPGTKKSSISPALWKVTNKHTGAVLWLFGSCDFVDEKALPLPDRVTEAYESSKILLLSRNYLDDAVDSDKIFKLYRYSEGSVAKKHIPEDIYQKARKIIYNAYTSTGLAGIDDYKPLYWVSYIQKIYFADSNVSGEHAADLYFNSMAKQDGKTIAAASDLESVQMKMINLSEELQIFMLKLLVDINPEDYNKQLMDFYDAWAIGATGYIENAIYKRGDFTEDESKLIAEYNKAIIEDENIKIAGLAEKYLDANNSVFACVGIEHLVGEKGIVKLLTDAGYDVAQVHTY
jgi:uncharacterized protein YbaP (TraB family)